MRRRNVLFAIGAWMHVLRFPSWSGKVRADEVTPEGAHDAASPEQLLKELERLDKRDYSQEGIPMILACENLAAGNPQIHPDRPIASNAELAALFGRYVEALPRVRTEVSESDVAKLVELVADQDFAAGGMGVSQ